MSENSSAHRTRPHPQWRRQLWGHFRMTCQMFAKTSLIDVEFATYRTRMICTSSFGWWCKLEEIIELNLVKKIFYNWTSLCSFWSLTLLVILIKVRKKANFLWMIIFCFKMTNISPKVVGRRRSKYKRKICIAARYCCITLLSLVCFYHKQGRSTIRTGGSNFWAPLYKICWFGVLSQIQWIIVWQMTTLLTA